MRAPSLSSATLESQDPHLTGDRAYAAPAAPRSGSLFAAVRDAVPGIGSLQCELAGLQRRLGTSLEQPGDFTRVREVAHKLNNLLCVSLLRNQLARLERIDYGGGAAA